MMKKTMQERVGEALELARTIAPIALTPDEIKQLSEAAADKWAAEDGFRIAITHYSNLTSHNRQRSDLVWRRIVERAGLNMDALDARGVGFKLDRTEPIVVARAYVAEDPDAR